VLEPLVVGLELRRLGQIGDFDAIAVQVENNWLGTSEFWVVLGSTLLGSRLIDFQSENMTVAASTTAERKTFGHLS